MPADYPKFRNPKCGMIDVSANEGGGIARGVANAVVSCLILHVIRSSLLVVQQVLKILPALCCHIFSTVISAGSSIFPWSIALGVLQASTLGAFLDPACAWISRLFKAFSPKSQISCSIPAVPSLELILGLLFQLASSFRCVQLFCEGRDSGGMIRLRSCRRHSYIPSTA